MLVAALALLAFLSIQPLAALQWRLLLPAPRPSYPRLLRTFALASTANNGINSFVGHAAATALVAREPGVGSGPAIALLVLDQLVVAIVKLLVLALAVVMASGSAPLQRTSVLLPLGCAIVALLALLALSRRMATLPAWIPQRVRTLVTPVHQARREPGAPGAVRRALPVGVMIRGMEALARGAMHVALGLTISTVQLPLLLGATAIATMLPIVPGNLGTYEGALVGVYLSLGVPLERALPAAALQHACQLTAAIVPGLLIAVLRVPHLRRPPTT